MRYLT